LPSKIKAHFLTSTRLRRWPRCNEVDRTSREALTRAYDLRLTTIFKTTQWLKFISRSKEINCHHDGLIARKNPRLEYD
jgi:hypothetical protein